MGRNVDNQNLDTCRTGRVSAVRGKTICERRVNHHGIDPAVMVKGPS